jgi:hypothetical protein
VLGVERHLLDEPQLVAVLEAEVQQRDGLVVVDAAQQDGVDLDRGEPGACAAPGRRGRRRAGRGG